jgi:hypothetical protein
VTIVERRSIRKLPARRRAPAACTIVTRSILSYARIVGESYLRHHPGSRFDALVVDRLPPGVEAGYGIEAVDPDALDLPYFDELCFKYEAIELSTALKPTLLSFLLECEDSIVYLDSDILVLRAFGELWTTLRSSPGRADAAFPQSDSARRATPERRGHAHLRRMQPRLPCAAPLGRDSEAPQMVEIASTGTVAASTSRTACSPTRSGSTSSRVTSARRRSSGIRRTTSLTGISTSGSSSCVTRHPSSEVGRSPSTTSADTNPLSRRCSRGASPSSSRGRRSWQGRRSPSS